MTESEKQQILELLAHLTPAQQQAFIRAAAADAQ